MKRFAGRVRSSPETTDVHNARVGQIRVSADWLRLQAHTPNVFRLLPKYKLRVGKGEMSFLGPDLEINSRV